ncbi:hypothetical protein [Halomicrobium urmianum]|uniref:hypothetical protein n=1 Tax=Halomicrobium urmianum TaxID=1586233 RepID=UPI001CD9B340|nr:hypothetical protein [Halomicrobium urmianum]
MTDDIPAVTSDEEFEEALTRLITIAHDNGVTVEGPWLCRNGDGSTSWEAIVVALDQTEED